MEGDGGVGSVGWGRASARTSVGKYLDLNTSTNATWAMLTTSVGNRPGADVMTDQNSSRP